MKDRLIELIGAFPVWGKTLKDQWFPEAVERFADHLLANGVIVPPCKVGDTVYVLVNWCDFINCHFDGCAGCSNCNDKGIVERKFNYSHLAQIGKTVFLTKEEAEKALAERSEGE